MTLNGSENMEIINVDVTASKGIVLAKSFIVNKIDTSFNEELVSLGEVDDEINKINDAIKQASLELESLVEKSDVFKAHLEVVNDPMLLDNIVGKITNEKMNAQLALVKATDEICSMFDAIDDEYLKERVVDIKDVSQRILCALKGIKLNVFDNIDEEVIVFASNLNPSDTAIMNFDFVKGFVTEFGGITGHIVIIARQLELPAMVGVDSILDKVKNGDFIILDGIENKIIINPTTEVEAFYKEKLIEFNKEKEELKRLNDLPAITLDSHSVELFANVGNADEAKTANNNKAEGIGLFRTELLYMNNTKFATEEEQFIEYKNTIENTNGPVIIRTLDIGGDKSLPYYKFDYEENPFLGFRAIRLCFKLKEEVFKPQLRAILRASAYGDIKVMYPMIISVDEFREANSILEECKEELRKENIDFNNNIETGIMIETPAAVIMSEKLAKEVDFFSIGTNDLTQYLLCVDRGNEKISNLYNTFNPAVLNAIKHVIESAHKYGKKVGVCGEFAADSRAVKILLGLGLDEFSMASTMIPSIRYLIRELNYEEAKDYANNICSKTTIEEVLELL